MATPQVVHCSLKHGQGVSEPGHTQVSTGSRMKLAYAAAEIGKL